jgi:adenylate kinase
MQDADVSKGFILDGYPRNVAQCEALDALLQRIGMPVQFAIQLDVDESVLLERLADRARKEGRADDSPESVKHRLHVYQAQTAPVVDFYAGKQLLQRIAGTGSVADINGRLLDLLQSS